jgi:hypothetical protein
MRDEEVLAEIKKAIDLQNQIDALRVPQMAALQHVALILETMDTGQVNKLDVPWIGQNTALTTDDWSNSDCGPAVIAMWLNFVGRVVTVDQVSAATGLARGYKYTLPAVLIKAAAAYGLNLERVINITPEAIKVEIDRRVPCIALVHYASLPLRNDPNFTAGHWLLIVGYDDQGVYYHDPYWPDSKGSFLQLTWAQLAKAMQDCTIDGNTPNQGLRSKAR